MFYFGALTSYNTFLALLILMLPWHAHAQSLLTHTPTGVVLCGSSDATGIDVDMSQCTGGMYLPVGNDAQRPSTAMPGMVRYNTARNCIETWNGTIWSPMGVPSVAFPTRPLNTAFQISTSRYTLVNYGVDVSPTVTLNGWIRSFTYSQ